MCSRWDQEVRETRHQIIAAARYLMKNDVMFVVERDVEIHIWKTVYYQVCQASICKCHLKHLFKVIEMLKASYLDVENTMPENRKTLKNSLMNLFEEGTCPPPTGWTWSCTMTPFEEMKRRWEVG